MTPGKMVGRGHVVHRVVAQEIEPGSACELVREGVRPSENGYVQGVVLAAEYRGPLSWKRGQNAPVLLSGRTVVELARGASPKRGDFATCDAQGRWLVSPHASRARFVEVDPAGRHATIQVEGRK